MKRRAPYELDRNELEKNNYDLPDTPQEPQNNNDAPVDLSKRRIVKLKNPSEVYASRGIDVNQAPAGKFTLAGQLDTNSTTENSNEAVPSFLDPKKPVTSSLFSNAHLHTQVEPSQNLWGQSKLSNANIGASLFMNNDYKKQEEVKKEPENGHSKPTGADQAAQPLAQATERKGGLFAGLIGIAGPPNVETSLFGNKPSIFDQKADNGPSDSLKTKLFGANPSAGGGLFGNASVFGGTLFQQTETKPSTDSVPKASLFASLLKEVDPKENAGGLFSNYLSTGNQTFEDLLKRSTSSNIFSDQKGAGGGDGGDDDDGEDGDDNDGDEPQGSKSPEADPSRATQNYQYEEHFEKIIQKPVEKFKLNNDQDTKTGTISLEKSKAAGTHHIVFRDTSKVIRFQGAIFKNLSRPKHMYEGKPHTMSVICYIRKSQQEIDSASKNKEGDATENKQVPTILSGFKQFVVKLSFPRADESIEFKEAVEKALQ